MRESGVLLPIFSLPSRYGIGCFSKEAFAFADQLAEAGQRYWQILPMGPTGFGDSPYQSYSTFAGNPYFIDLETLIQEGLLTEEECSACDFGQQESYVDYDKLKENRIPLLYQAFKRFRAEGEDYQKFLSENESWLQDYCLYMAIKDQQEDISWNEWPRELRSRQEEALEEKRVELKENVDFHRFLQFEFARQWRKLKKYVNEKGIRIIGDIPIYVAPDSADAWANPEMFQFDEEGKPIAVAGCPPDGFSATGQLWGNPLYRWEYHRKTGYRWWMQRMAHSFTLTDGVRIDHFRGFDEYYAIPYGDETAEFGHWEKGPGLEFFRVMKEKLGDQQVIAEDLGYLTPSVLQLVKDTGFPGMKVLEFAFDGSEDSFYLPVYYDKNCVVYTGTHDNDTAKGWFASLNGHDAWMAREYMNLGNKDEDSCVWELIRLAMSSVADLAVIPLQDYLCLDTQARVNKPATVGNNWKWRLKNGQFTQGTVQAIRNMTRLYRRLG